MVSNQWIGNIIEERDDGKHNEFRWTEEDAMDVGLDVAQWGFYESR